MEVGPTRNNLEWEPHKNYSYKFGLYWPSGFYFIKIYKGVNSEQYYKGKVKTHKYINRQNQSTTGKLKTVMTLTWYTIVILGKWWVEPIKRTSPIATCGYAGRFCDLSPGNRHLYPVKVYIISYIVRQAICYRDYYILINWLYNKKYKLRFFPFWVGFT
jgi:hypothetical protein